MTDEQKKDMAFAREINRQTRSDPDSPNAGKYVGVLRQQVVAVGDTLDEVETRLEELGVGPRQGVCIEASADYDRTYHIWESAPCRG